jgi:ferric enterobactin receptor
VEGTVRWSDGSAAAGLVVAITELKLTATTDQGGRYVFDPVKPGIRVAIDVSMGPRVLGGTFTLVSLAVERIDIQLAGTIANPVPPPPARPEGVERGAATAAVAPPTSSATEVVTFSADGVPTLSADVSVTATLPMLSTSTEAGRVRLAPDQVAALPSLGTRDIFRALQLLPGVSSNETSSGLFVRGGTPDQNLVDYDGFTVYSVDHLFGYFSAFNMDAIDAVDLSKGGYEARYGGRLSSLTEIRGKSRPLKVGGSVGTSLLSADGVLDVPLGSKASFLVGHRRSFQSPLYDRILSLVNTEGAPPGEAPGGRFAAVFNSQPRSSFDDWNGRFEFRPSSRDQLAVSVYLGNDDLDNSRDLELPASIIERLASRGITLTGGLNVTDIRDFRNTGISGRWDHEWGARARTSATFARSDFDTLTQRSSSVGGRQGNSGELNVVDDTTLKIDTGVTFSPTQELTFGVQHTTNRVGYQLENSQFGAAGSGGSEANTLTSQLNRTTTGDLTSLYAQHQLSFGTRLFATPGIRVTQFSGTDSRFLEPRLSATVLASETFRIKGAWGRYQQFVNRLVREEVFQGNREFWALSDDSTIPVAASTNMAVGATYETSRLLLDAEFFARDLSDLTQLAPRVLGSTEGVDLTQLFYRGAGHVRGLEALVQRKAGRHTGWASYTLSRVTYDFPDLSGRFLADHDRTHELKLVDTFQLNRWTLSGTWIFSTGRPYTEPIGTESVTRPGPLEDLTFERVVVGAKNGVRLPAYHRLDVAANYSWPIGDSGRTAMVGVSAFNAYNRSNV